MHLTTSAVQHRTEILHNVIESINPEIFVTSLPPWKVIKPNYKIKKGDCYVFQLLHIGSCYNGVSCIGFLCWEDIPCTHKLISEHMFSWIFFFRSVGMSLVRYTIPAYYRPHKIIIIICIHISTQNIVWQLTTEYIISIFIKTVGYLACKLNHVTEFHLLRLNQVFCRVLPKCIAQLQVLDGI